MNVLYMTISYDLQEEGLYQDLIHELLNREHKLSIVRPKQDTKLLKIKENLKILNVKAGNPFESNKFKKGINQILINYFFKKAIKKFFNNDKFDLILYATPPITLCGTIKYCKKKYKAKTFLMLKDIFPQNAVDLNMISKKGLIYKYFRNQEQKYYKISDFIGCMSKKNIDFVKKNNSNIPNNKIGLFPNSIKIKEENTTIFNQEKTIFIFGGNLGIPQNINGLLRIIDKVNDYKNAEFIIIGQGTEKEKIQNFINSKKISNTVFKDFIPQNEYEKILQKADVGLISLDPRFTIPNIPSKFQTYLKLKKPVLAITDINTDLKEMILENDCGWWCDALQEEKIINLIKEICENKRKQIEKGEKGFEYLRKEFNVEKNVDLLEEFIKKEFKVNK